METKCNSGFLQQAEPSFMADFSSLGLTKYSAKKDSQLEKSDKFSGANLAFRPKSLDVHDNSLVALEDLTYLKGLVCINAGGNLLTRFGCFNSLRETLTDLDISSNRFHSLEGLNALENLRQLNLAENNVEEVPVLYNLNNLISMNLSNNQLTCVPDLHNLGNLTILILSGNKIGHLEADCCRRLPAALETLNLSHNRLADLSEISRLSSLSELKTLWICGNPCVTLTEKNVCFDYRPYLICWCAQLDNVDGFVVTELESLKGEMLHMQGKGRKYAPGSHSRLVEYLAESCPLGAATSTEFGPEPLRRLTDFDAKIQRVLEKRREYLAKNTSLQSPPQVDRDKENELKSDKGGVGTDYSRLPTSRSPLSPRQCGANKATSTPGQKTTQVRDVGRFDTPMTRTPQAVLRVAKNKNKAEKSGETSVANSGNLCPTLVAAAARIQQWWRRERLKFNSEVVGARRELRLRRIESYATSHETRVVQLEEKVENMAQVNANLAQVVEELAQELRAAVNRQEEQSRRFASEMSAVREKCDKFESTIKAVVPVPFEVRYQPKDQNSIIVRWKLKKSNFDVHEILMWSVDNIPYSEFLLFVDGELCGRVGNGQTCALITDLDPAVAHCVEVESVTHSGVCSARSTQLIIPIWFYGQSSKADGIGVSAVANGGVATGEDRGKRAAEWMNNSELTALDSSLLDLETVFGLEGDMDMAPSSSQVDMVTLMAYELNYRSHYWCMVFQ